MSDITEILKELKQQLYNNMVEGYSPEPAEVVDSVCFALKGTVLDKEQVKEITNFYPDYTRGTE